MADKFLKKKFYNPFEDENFIIERIVEENNIKFYELNYYDTYFEDYIPVSDIDSFIEDNNIKEVVDDESIKERARKKKKEIDKIKEDEENKKEKKKKKKKSSNRRRRLFAFLDEINWEKFIGTEWINPNEGNEKFKITEIVDDLLSPFGNSFKLEYDEFYDFISAANFDAYCADNKIQPYSESAERVYPLLKLTKAANKKKIIADINDIGNNVFENLGEDGRKLLQQIENYKYKMNDSKNLLINEKDQKKLEKSIQDLDNVSAFISDFVYELENYEIVDQVDKKLEFKVEDEIDEDIELPEFEEDDSLDEENLPENENTEDFENPFDQANKNDQQMIEEPTQEEPAPAPESEPTTTE